MEFFASADLRITAAELQKHLRIHNLPAWCASIGRVLGSEGDRGDIDCIGGEYRVHREVILNGLRFSLPGSPDALQWTVTSEGAGPNCRVLIHLTINGIEPAPAYADSLRQFVADWQTGLASGLAKARTVPPDSGECMPWYG